MVQILVSAIITGAVYSMLAIGLVSIYRSTRVFNFAHAQFAALGAYCGFAVTVSHGLPFWVGGVTGTAVGAVLGLIIERVLLVRLYGRSNLEIVVATFAFAMIIRSVINLGWNSDIRTIPDPFNSSSVSILGATVPWYGVLLVACALALVVGMSFVLRRTEIGLALRAAFDDPVAARLQGIRVSRIRTASWVFGGALAGLGGFLLTPVVYLNPGTMDTILILAFAAVVIGGMTSFWGAVLGAVAIAVGVNLLGFYVSLEFKDVFVYVLVLVLLCTRPQGFFGDGHEHEEVEESSATRGRLAGRLRRMRVVIDSRRAQGGRASLVGRRYAPAVVAAAVVIVVVLAPQIFGRGNQSSLTAWLINSIAVMGTVLVIHYGGRFFLGQTAFMAIGAYVTALMLDGGTADWIVVIVVAVVVASLAGIVFEVLTLRLSGVYYALATLVLALVTPLIAVKWVDVTGGEDGHAVPLIGPEGAPYDSSQLLALVAQISVVVFVALLVLRSLGVGRGVIAVRDSTHGARSIGIGPLPRRLGLAGVATGLGGLAGALSAITSNVVTPHTFNLDLAFMLFVAAVVAGAVVWSYAGAAIITLVPILLADVPEISQAVYGVAIILSIFVLPKRRDSLDQLVPSRLPARISECTSGFANSPVSERSAEKVVG
ncbi:ABC transporter permease [Rhodococcus koreensis]